MTILTSKLLWAGGTTAVVAAMITGASGQQRRGGYPYQTGREIYEHVCQGCHMPDAKGAVGAGMYPALAGNRKLQGTAYPVLVMLRGQKAMPSFSDLSDAQIAETANYIRSNFGNQFPGAATPEQVSKLRPQQVQRDAQATGVTLSGKSDSTCPTATLWQ